MPGVKQPAVENKYFIELTHRQREHAVALGYKGATWDNPPIPGSPDAVSTDGTHWAGLTVCSKLLPRSVFVRLQRLDLEL